MLDLKNLKVGQAVELLSGNWYSCNGKVTEVTATGYIVQTDNDYYDKLRFNTDGIAIDSRDLGCTYIPSAHPGTIEGGPFVLCDPEDSEEYKRQLADETYWLPY